MKKLFTLLFISVSVLANAQVTWDFATATPTSGVVANSTVSDVSQGNNNGTTTLLNSTSVSSGYVGASGTNNAGAAARTGTLNTAAAGSAYFEVTITPSTSYQINVTNVATGTRRTATGPILYSVRSSLDGFTTDLSTVASGASGVWGLSTFPAFNITGTSNTAITLRIYGSDGTGAATSGNANWRIDDLKITYNSLNVLPVTLSSFTGSYANKTSLLKWTVGNEINISKYAVERSEDGRTFNEIGFVNATGNTEYSYTDASATTAINFYRLRIVGANEIKYSAVVKILSDAFNLKLNVYPSPAVNSINAEFSSDNKAMANVQMTDVSGRIVLQKNRLVQQGYNNLNFDITTLNKGMYIFKITIAGKVTSTVINKL